MPNRLSAESSPYLRQHAENPVDWYPWGEEALAAARTLDKPILLSIGYSACHWCHVMAHESFENLETARTMNDNFVNIKVDREERPDLDSIYMEAVQSITGSGGWPLTVFLTPRGKPYYGGTYFPPDDRRGLPGFRRVLLAAANAYRNRRTEVDRATAEIAAALKHVAAASGEPISASLLDRAYAATKPLFDNEHGGFGVAPKFPQTMVLEFLLRHCRRTADEEALRMVTYTLEKMAAGGIYDQLGGGFHRYATDRIWLVPHFEKMLYDNALLSRAYTQAFQVTHRPEFRRIAEETLDYVLTDMTSPEGGLYSTRDADSEGVEGKFYVWDMAEVLEVLGRSVGEEVCRYYGITTAGNFEGKNILHAPGGLDAGLPDDIRQARAALLKRRQTRIPPQRDEKVVASWNGLMLASLADAALVFDRADCLKAAEANGAFLLDGMTQHHYLRHIWKDGEAKVEGFLEDYACIIEGMLCLHRATFSGRWLQAAIRFAEIVLDEFWDGSAGVFHDTGRRHEVLFVRPRSVYDGSVPSASSAATFALLKIARLTGRADMERAAVGALQSMSRVISQSPTGFANWLCALDFHLATPVDVVLVGARHSEETRVLLDVLCDTWLPNKLLLASDPQDPAVPAGLPLLEGKRTHDSRTTVYICRQFTCGAPLTTVEALREQLKEDS